MLSIDTNILFYASYESSPFYAAARDWLQSISSSDDVIISEFALTELYGLFRNRASTAKPLTAGNAVHAINYYRTHPRWRLVGFTADSRKLHDKLWSLSATENFPYRKIYDARLALTLQHHGVTRFATVNEKDFAGLGFARVWNPLVLR
ncbi:MAG: PIN domain-containing protein [Verrucomicrobiales bacterium]|jgi:toxin-antitoxin system PIN domain toxin|nr:PIN domain-containing protein [Verrucomicrobiales bacterium]